MKDKWNTFIKWLKILDKWILDLLFPDVDDECDDNNTFV
jgi:hypothetical protein